MEAAATAVGIVGLAGLYGTCMVILDALSSAARYGIDREILQTKIEVERIRLMIWAESAGLADIDLSSDKNDPSEDDLAGIDDGLHRTALRTAVASLLTCFVRTFDDIEELQKRYGLALESLNSRQADATTPPQAGSLEEDTEPSARKFLTSTFSKTYARFQGRVAASQKQATSLSRAKWAVADETKFRALINELRAINDSLISLLPAVHNRTRVRMRAEIMRATDVEQLHSLVDAAGDSTSLVAETASLRIEMLSSKEGVAARREVYVAPPTTPSPQKKVEMPEPPLWAPKMSEEGTNASLPPQPGQPLSEPYDNTGALIVHRVYKDVHGIWCYSWLSVIGDVPEPTTTQPEFHPAFELRHVPESILPFAENLFMVDVMADPKYSGWSPGSVSLTGFSRELSYWNYLGNEAGVAVPSWPETIKSQISMNTSSILKRWSNLMSEGLGKDWTEQKGYDSVRELIGPSQHTWIDPNETIKIRHQISDLSAVMSSPFMPDIEQCASIGLVALSSVYDPNSRHKIVDFLLQMLLAREVLLRLQKSKHPWHGGITRRILYDMIASERWGASMGMTLETVVDAHKAVRERQITGIVKFAEEMQWPYLSEIQETAKKLLNADITDIHNRLFEWWNGLVLPGSMFPLAMVSALYTMSPTLITRELKTKVEIRRDNYGVIYPQASYWAVRSIVGKVLAPLSLSDAATGKKVKCIGGWVGPCPSPSLPESTFGLLVMVNSRPPPFVSGYPGADGDGEIRNTMSPKAQGQHGNTVGWKLPAPPPPSTDVVTLQTLRLAKVDLGQTAPSSSVTGAAASPVYRARLDFLLRGGKTMMTTALHTNSAFVAAMPCRGGPHRIEALSAAAYTFRTLRVEELVHSEIGNATTAITIIDATGGAVAETLARAWCSEKGSNAVVWKRGDGCCFKCALVLASSEGAATGALIMC